MAHSMYSIRHAASRKTAGAIVGLLLICLFATLQVVHVHDSAGYCIACTQPQVEPIDELVLDDGRSDSIEPWTDTLADVVLIQPDYQCNVDSRAPPQFGPSLFDALA